MKEDEIALRIEAFDAAIGGGVGWYQDKGAYHLYLPTCSRSRRRSPSQARRHE
jgi:hypothetical protein